MKIEIQIYTHVQDHLEPNTDEVEYSEPFFIFFSIQNIIFSPIKAVENKSSSGVLNTKKINLNHCSNLTSAVKDVKYHCSSICYK